MTHWNQLRDLQVTRVEREVFESSLRSGRCVLELMGHGETSAQDITARFREHNLALIEQMYPIHQDRAKLIAVARQARQQLEAQMALERAQRAQAPSPPSETPPQ